MSVAYASRVRRALLLGGLLFGGLLSLVACAGPTMSHPSGPFDGVPRHAKVGELVHLGQTWIATITRVSTSAGQGDETPGGGDVYLILDMSFKNVTFGAQSLYTVGTLFLQDAAGRRYTQITTSFTTPPDGTVAAGATGAGTIAFVVPKSQRTFLLAYDAGSAGHAIWDLALA